MQCASLIYDTGSTGECARSIGTAHSYKSSRTRTLNYLGILYFHLKFWYIACTITKKGIAHGGSGTSGSGPMQSIQHNKRICSVWSSSHLRASFRREIYSVWKARRFADEQEKTCSRREDTLQIVSFQRKAQFIVAGWQSRNSQIFSNSIFFRNRLN